MTEKSGIEILQDFAKRTNREINFKVKNYVPSKIRPRYLSKTQAIIPNNHDKTSFYIGYSDLKGFGDNAFYCGVFIPLSAPTSSKIIIRKKNILDKINPFLKKSNYKSGIESFNSSIVVEENDIVLTKKIFSNSIIQRLTLKSFKLDERIKVGINCIDLAISPELKGKSHFDIFIAEQWFLEASVIEKLFALIEEFRKELS